MFAGAFQSGFITIFYSVGSSPLSIWDKSVKNGHIRRIVDEEVKSLVLEIAGTNVATTYITCPIKPRASLGIKMPFLVMVVKNMKKYFSFEIQIVDDKEMRRRFRVSNFQSTTKVRPFCTTMPIGLSSGWNQIQFNLADFTRRAYGTVYMETIRVQVHANVRIRRIYFSDRLYTEDELPSEYKLFMPLEKKDKKKTKPSKEAIKEAKPSSKEKIPEPIVVEEPEAPVAAPPSPAEPAPEEKVIEEEDEVGATSIEPAAGDVADIAEVEEQEAPEAEEAAGEKEEEAVGETDGEDEAIVDQGEESPVEEPEAEPAANETNEANEEEIDEDEEQ